MLFITGMMLLVQNVFMVRCEEYIIMNKSKEDYLIENTVKVFLMIINKMKGETDMFAEFEKEEMLNDEDLYVAAFTNDSASTNASNVSDSCCC